MLVEARASGDLRVRDVSNEDVTERKLMLAAERGPLGAAHELLAVEAVQELLGRRSVRLTDAHECTCPKHLPEHGCVLQQLLLVGRQRAEAGGGAFLHWLL